MTTKHRVASMAWRVERWVQLIARNVWAYIVPANIWAFEAKDVYTLEARCTLVVEGLFLLFTVLGVANFSCFVCYVVAGAPVRSDTGFELRREG